MSCRWQIWISPFLAIFLINTYNINSTKIAVTGLVIQPLQTIGTLQTSGFFFFHHINVQYTFCKQYLRPKFCLCPKVYHQSTQGRLSLRSQKLISKIFFVSTHHICSKMNQVHEHISSLKTLFCMLNEHTITSQKEIGKVIQIIIQHDLTYGIKMTIK